MRQALFNRVTLDLGRTVAADQPTDVRIAQHASVSDPLDDGFDTQTSGVE